MAEDFTPPGERSFAEREERRVEAINDEELRKEKAKENEFVEIDDEGNIIADSGGGSSSNNDSDKTGNTSSSSSSKQKNTVKNEIDQVESRINELEQAKESGGFAPYVPSQLERKKERLNELQGRNPSEEIDKTGNVVFDPEDNKVLGQGDTAVEATANAQLNTGRAVKGFTDRENINQIQKEKKDIVQNRIQQEKQRIDRLQSQQEKVRQEDAQRFNVTINGEQKTVNREDLLARLEQKTTEAFSRKGDFEDFTRDINTDIQIDTKETTEEETDSQEKEQGLNLVDPDGSQTDFDTETVLDNQPETTFVEQGLNTVEEKSQELVLAADREKDIISDLSQDFEASNVGNDFAAIFEAFAGAEPTVQQAQDFKLSKPLKSTEEVVETGKEQIFDPLLISSTKANEAGLIEPSQDLKERTRSIQSTAATTPLDTAGFLGATSAGLGTITIEQGSRFATRSGRELTGDEDIGRDIDPGEGIERIPVGANIIAESLSKNPGKFAQEEITQEVTEAVLGLGAPTLTVTTTPSSLKTRFEGSVKTAGEKAKQTASKTKDAITDPNALGAGAGAFLPSETATETPSATKDTVTVDRDALDTFEVNPLQPETLPSSATKDTVATIDPLNTAVQTTTVAEEGPITQSKPEAVTQSRPETLTETTTETLTDTPSAVQTPSLSQTSTITSSVTRTPSLTDTLTPTRTQTPTISNTQTPTSTPTPTPDFEDDNNLLNGESNEEEKETSTEFLPSVDALLTGQTEKVDDDEVFTGFETRPLQEL